jgi:hypothetical protein
MSFRISFVTMLGWRAANSIAALPPSEEPSRITGPLARWSISWRICST